MAARAFAISPPKVPPNRLPAQAPISMVCRPQAKRNATPSLCGEKKLAVAGRPHFSLGRWVAASIGPWQENVESSTWSTPKARPTSQWLRTLRRPRAEGQGCSWGLRSARTPGTRRTTDTGRMPPRRVWRGPYRHAGESTTNKSSLLGVPAEAPESRRSWRRCRPRLGVEPAPTGSRRPKQTASFAPRTHHPDMRDLARQPRRLGWQWHWAGC